MTVLGVESSRRSDGFGLVEVIVSMFLLSLMALVFLPVLTQAMHLTASNASIATATQLLSADLEQARPLAVTCNPLPASTASVHDGLAVTGEWELADGCSTGVSAMVKYTSTVIDRTDRSVLAQVVTLILVSP
ncbi:prepilin-type N-terminal cleavage/methylation domain-containing protein [Cryobacterium sp. N21]|uniref:type IV pilus modification PilV family protein n=1 Tax=Cryobacterium sp. N21 TaxID=2048289 RepID=UPI000CE3D624|nr:prepilin-type N-terminal cleavage/methylation domain-containing protein [Cryobacterium sp. N21]